MTLARWRSSFFAVAGRSCPCARSRSHRVWGVIEADAPNRIAARNLPIICLWHSRLAAR